MSFRHTRFGRSLITAMSTFALALSPILILSPASAAANSPKSTDNSETVEGVAGKPSKKSEKAKRAKKPEAKGDEASKKAKKSQKNAHLQKAGKKKAKRGPASIRRPSLKGETGEQAEQKAKTKPEPKAERSEPKEKAQEKSDMTALSKPVKAEAEKPAEPAAKAEKKPETVAKAESSAEAKSVKASKAEKSAKAEPKASKPAKNAKEKQAHSKPVKAKAGKAKPGAKKTASRASSPKRKTAKSAGKSAKKGGNDKDAPKPPCFGPAVNIDRSGLESESLALVYCDGRPVLSSRDRLSAMARPWGAPRPEMGAAESGKAGASSPKGSKAGAKLDEMELAPGIRRLDPGLLVRLNRIAQKYPKRNISIVSGYRPQSKGSLHQSGRALDVRVMGIANEELVNFCKTLEDTGCGYYPNSSFVHVDVRQPKTGSVAWIDASGPGEAPRYVSVWPPPKEEAPAEAAAPNEAQKTADGEEQGKPGLEPQKPQETKESPAASEPKPEPKAHPASAKSVEKTEKQME